MNKRVSFVAVKKHETLWRVEAEGMGGLVAVNATVCNYLRKHGYSSLHEGERTAREAVVVLEKGVRLGEVIEKDGVWIALR